MQQKRKLGPTDRQSGSVHVTTTPPRHADKDCLTTEENVTISSSRITRQGRCRSGAAESSLVARNNQPTKTRSPQRTTVDTRTVAWWNLRANVTDDENERRTAQRRTCKGGRRSRKQLASKKKRQACPSTQCTSKIGRTVSQDWTRRAPRTATLMAATPG